MNSLVRIPYGFAGAIAQALTHFVPAGDSKFQRGLFARRGVLGRYEQWSAARREPSRPLVWFHAPSVGEGLQALPVLQLLRSRRPDVQIAYTHFSPSAERFARSTGADFVDYLPFDTFSAARAAVSALRPAALVFSKLDVWPALTETAARRDVRIGLISATLPESSGRRSRLAREALADAYAALDRVGAISEADAQRLREQGVPTRTITVTGDTRYDQVWARARAPGSTLVESLRSASPTLVAGSTWPADETHLLAAWTEVRRRVAGARLVIAPHELSEGYLGSVTEWARANDLKLSRLSEPRHELSDVVLVDRYGVLGDLYALADVAYVGGGFHAAGLHSVLEPAAFGSPVLFGPNHRKSREAAALLGCGGARVVSGRDDLARQLVELLSSKELSDSSGAAALAHVQSGLGAAERSYQLVTELLGR